jgi:hypothetical protein
VSCLKNLRNEGIELQLFWYNPNIHPYTEYKSRRDCLIEFADNENITLMNIDEHGLFSFPGGVCPDMENRCEKCYRIRLEKTASAAAQGGFQTFTTTLLISPYQDHETIKRIGEETACKYGVEFFYKDFRPFFREGQATARTGGMYMQKYCGCIFSGGKT